MATDNQIKAALEIAYDAGFRGLSLVYAVAIAIRESGLNAKARCYNVRDPATGRNYCYRSPDGGPPPPGVKVESVDRGWWQINSKAHPTVTDAMADDPRTAAREAYRISGRGTNFRPWVAFTTGAFRDVIARVSRIAEVIVDDLPKVGEQFAYSDPSGAAGDTGSRPPAAAEPAGLGDLIPGPFGDLLGGLGGLAGGIFGGITDRARKELLQGVFRIAVTGALLVGGVALVVVGAHRAVAPTVRRAADDAAAAVAAVRGAA